MPNPVEALRLLMVSARPMLRMDLLNDLEKAHTLVELERALIVAGRTLRESEGAAPE